MIPTQATKLYDMVRYRELDAEEPSRQYAVDQAATVSAVLGPQDAEKLAPSEKSRPSR